VRHPRLRNGGAEPVRFRLNKRCPARHVVQDSRFPSPAQLPLLFVVVLLLRLPLLAVQLRNKVRVPVLKCSRSLVQKSVHGTRQVLGPFRRRPDVGALMDQTRRVVISPGSGLLCRPKPVRRCVVMHRARFHATRTPQRPA
jgi:hypothetical protein